MKNNQEQGHLFSNPICKETYNSLPKIYGKSNNKTNRSLKQEKKNGLYLSSRHHHCISSAGVINKEKKTLTEKQYSNTKSRYLSIPKPQKCTKKNCSCNLIHEDQIKTLKKLRNSASPKKKIKLRPLQSSRPDDFESEHKVAMRISTEPNMPAGLASIIKTQRNLQIQFGKKLNLKQSYINQIIQSQDTGNQTHRHMIEEEFPPTYSQKQSLPRSYTQQIAVDTGDNLPRTISQPYSLIQSNLSIVSGIPQKQTASVEIQVNIDDAIQKRSEAISSEQNIISQANHTVTSNYSSYRQKAYLTKYKRMKPRKSKYYISQQQDNQQSQNQQPQDKQKNKKKSLGLSRMSSSSLSLTSCLVKGLNSNSTQFKKLNTIQDSQQRSSRAKSTKSNGTFRIPSQNQYASYLKTYKVLDKKGFNIKQLVKKPLFSIVQEDEGVYFGEYQNDKKVGNGINITQKQIFEGVYENNIKIKGCQRNIDGVYRGYFINGKRQGYGTFQWNNGQKFQGNWRQGVKQGFGIWRSPKGDSYQGEWHNNRQHGEGVFRHKNSTYKGQFQNFLKHGKGQERFLNGDSYIGEYKQGKPDGKGKYVWHDGGSYQGQFKNGLRCGYGKLIQKNGTIYQGQFEDDFKHGEGTQYDASGQVFEGTFKKGLIFKGYLHKKQITAEYIDNS